MCVKALGLWILSLGLYGCVTAEKLEHQGLEIEDLIKKRHQVYSNDLCQSIEHSCFEPKTFEQWKDSSGEIKCICR